MEIALVGRQRDARLRRAAGGVGQAGAAAHQAMGQALGLYSQLPLALLQYVLAHTQVLVSHAGIMLHTAGRLQSQGRGQGGA